MSKMMKWTNVDPREIFTDISTQNIVILRPALGGGTNRKAGTGYIDTHHVYAIFTSFEDYQVIGPDDKWDISWLWIIGPS